MSLFTIKCTKPEDEIQKLKTETNLQTSLFTNKPNSENEKMEAIYQISLFTNKPP